MSFISFIENLKNILQQPLPGREAQNIMASGYYLEKRIDLTNLSGHKKSAVCLLFYVKNSVVHFLLIKRPDSHKYHASQLALPGGSCEPGEAYEETALRELEEETGIKINESKILGKLTPLYIPVSNFYIQPIVAFTDDELVFTRSEEVDYFIELPLKDILNESIIGETEVQASNHLKFKTPYFNVQGLVLWGATAMILSEVKQLIKENDITFSFLFQ